MFRHKPSSRRTLQQFGLAALGSFLMFAFASLPGHAQATQGAIIGSIKDAAGAVIPNAAVTLTNADEGTVRVGKSNSVGDYRFLDVKAGHYTLDVEATGFEKWSATGVTLEVRQELRVDAALAVGAVQQSVQVTGDSVALIDGTQHISECEARRLRPIIHGGFGE